MKVTLIDYTGAGAADPARHAANVLVFTKSTRLEMRAGLMDEVAAKPWEEIEAELDYMANTIPSSWEFVEYKFLIEDVTRGFTHQFVRTRTASFAQQTMRVLNVGGWTFGTGPTVELQKNRRKVYKKTMMTISEAYDALVADGANIEDARGILPTNIHTNIVAKFDLRSMADTARKRASSRTQGEYRNVMEAMKAEVQRVHPWAEKFFCRSFDRSAADLETRIIALAMSNNIGDEQKTHLIKLIDQMRMTA
jgi:flavin-dependent thymidylate synthase